MNRALMFPIRWILRPTTWRRLGRALKKSLCLLMAAVFFATSMSASADYAWGEALDFIFSPRQSDRGRASGYYSPQQLKEHLDYKNRVVESQNRAEAMMERQKAKVLDKIKNNVNANVRENLQTTQDMARQAEDARSRVFSILGENTMFNYVRYEDGKTVRLQDGLAKQVENERVMDAQGNVSLRTTYNMEYNDKRLLSNYESDTLDPLSNLTHVEWTGGTYTDDSVYYASDDTNGRKLITGYVQKTRDSFGNVTQVSWSGAVYDSQNLLVGYHQVSLDEHGNQSSKDWFGAQYDANGQVIEFNEVETDSLGNTKTRNWTGGTYVKNPAFSEDLKRQGISQTVPEYLLIGYREKSVDQNGVETVKDWTGANFDPSGRLESYREAVRDAQGRLNDVYWHNGRYDEFGRLTHYEQTSTDPAGAQTTTVWDANGYSQDNRLQGYTESATDPLGLTTLTRRSDIAYNPKGEILSYRDGVTDPHGNVSTKEWNADSYDTHGRVMAYREAATDALGLTTARVWNDAVYDSGNRLLSYHEDFSDAFQNVSQRDWRAAYDVNGRLETYEEAQTDALGNATRKEWEAGAYDFADRIAAYRQTVTDPDGNRTLTSWKSGVSSQEGYNVAGQVLAYEEEITDVYGQTHRRQWRDGTYDSYGNLESFEEVLTDAGGSETIHLWDQGSYDGYNRLTSFEEMWSARGLSGEFEPAQFHEWSLGEYDGYGRILSFEEMLLSPSGEGTFYSEKETLYDSYGRKISYLSESTGPDGIAYLTARSQTSYDSRGRATALEETTVSAMDPELLVARSVSGRGYDRYGRATQGEEETLTRGTDRNGASVNVRTLQTIEDGLLEKGSLVSYRQESVTSGRGPSGETLDSSEILTVSDINSFSETQTIRRLSEGLDHSTVIRRAGILRNLSGQIVGYQDNIQDNAASGGQTQTLRSQTLYGSQGEVLGYRERTTDLQGQVTDRTLAGMLYNGQRQTLGYSESTLRMGDDDALLETTERLNTVYDVLGRMTGYSEIMESPSLGRLQETEWQALAFNGAGQVIEDVNRAVYGSRGLFSSEYEVATHRSGVLYNLLGQVTDSQESVWDSRSKDLSTIRALRGISYDSYGAAAMQEETTRTQGRTTQKLPETGDMDQAMLAGLALLSAGQEFQWDALTAGEKGELLAGRSVTKTNGSGTVTLSLAPGESTVLIVILDLATRIVRDQASFDHKGRLSGYRETTTQSGENLEKTETRIRSDMAYDAGGRLRSYQEAAVSSEAPNVLTTVVRAEMRYDPKGQLSSYRDVTTERDGVLLLKRLESKRSGVLYDARGQILEYQDEISGTGILGKRRIQRSQAAFDAQGHLSGYRETVADSDGYAVATEVRSMAYNGLGQETGREETVTTQAHNEEGEEIYSLTVQRKTDHTVYDSIGQRIHYRQTETSSDATALTRKTVWSGGAYNGQGQLYSYKETVRTQGKSGGENLNLAVTTERLSTTYNGRGQISGYEEAVTRSDAPGMATQQKNEGMIYHAEGTLDQFVQTLRQTGQNLLGQAIFDKTTVTRRLNTEYDGKGLVEGMTEEIQTLGNSGSQDLNVVQTVESRNRAYNRARVLVGYDESRSSSNAPELATETHWEAQVDKDGRVASSIKTDKTGDRVQTVSRNVMEYDAFGREKAYREEDTDSSQPALTTVLEWRGNYDDQGRMETFAESRRTYDKTDPAKLDLTSTRRRTQTGYDSFGQVVSYKESSTDGLGSGFSTEWEGEYDALGQQRGFSERTVQTLAPSPSRGEGGGEGEDGLRIERQTHRQDAAYDDLGRLLSYREESSSNDSPDLILKTAWNAGGHDGAGRADKFTQVQEKWRAGLLEDDLLKTETTVRNSTAFDDAGRAVRFEETQTASDLPGMTATLERLDTSYDSYGRMNANHENKIQTGSNDEEEAVLEIETDRRLISRSYDSLGRLLSEESGETANGLTSRRVWTAAGYSGASQVLGFTETSSRSGLGLDTGRVTVRSGAAYDIRGRLLSYEESATDSASPDLTVETSWEAEGYDGLGRLTGFEEEIRQTDRHAGLDPASSNNDGFLETLQIRSRSDMVYSGLDRLESYRDNLNDLTLGTQRESLRLETGYNNLGQVTGYSETARNGFEGEEEGGGGWQALAVIERDGMAYDLNGNMKTYHEIRGSSDQPDITVVTDWTGSSDAAGRLTSEEEIARRRDAVNGLLDVTVQTSRSNFTYDGQGRQLSYHQETSGWDGVQELDWSNASYNGLGQLAAFREETSQAGVTARADHSGIVYGSNGLKTGENVETVSSDRPDLTVTQTWSDITYEGGLQDSFRLLTERKGELEDGSKVNVTSLQLRLNTEYNSKGQAVGSLESITSSEEPDVIRTAQTDGTLYNALGQILSKIETTRRLSSDGSLDQTSTNEQIDIAYDSLGRQTGFVQKITASETPDLATTITRSGIQYDSEGRISAYSDHTAQDGGSTSLTTGEDEFQVETTNSRSNIVYDDQGRMLSYGETALSATGTTEQNWQAQGYNGFGQLTGWEESGTGPLGTFGRATSQARYDDQERKLSYKEEGTSQNAGDYSKTWSGGQYNGKGQLSGYNERGTSLEAGNYVRTWSADFSDAYNVSGQQKHYREVLVRNFGEDVLGETKTTDREWKNGVYNGLGQLMSFLPLVSSEA